MAVSISISTSNVTANSVTVSWTYSNPAPSKSILEAYVQGPGGVYVDPATSSSSTSATGLSPSTSYTWTYYVAYYEPTIGENIVITKTATATTLAGTSPPVWTDSSIGTNAQVSVSFSNGVAATGATSYSVASGALPTGLSLNTSTGAVTGTPSATGTYSGTLRATNSGGSITTSFNVVIWSAVAWTDSTIVTNGQRGVAYSDDVSASGSPTPTYSVSSGSLPPGLSLNTNNGNLTGTPTTSGTYNFTLRAAHSYSNTTSAKTFVVWDPVAWTDNTILLTATEDDVYSDGVSASGSPAATYSITTGSLPSGLSLNGTTGAITGTIGTGTAGSYSFTIKAENAYSNVTASFTMTISAVAPPGGTIRTIKVYNGFTWVPVAQTYWNGDSWVERTVKVYNGMEWEQIL